MCSGAMCDILVTNELKRSITVLLCVARGTPIVSSDWIEESFHVGQFAETTEFLIKDVSFEEKYDFCLVDTLKAAKAKKLLEGFHIYTTRNVVPSARKMKGIIECASGNHISSLPKKRSGGDVIVVSSDKDLSDVVRRKAFGSGIPVVTSEFVLSGILKYDLNVEEHSMCNATEPRWYHCRKYFYLVAVTKYNTCGRRGRLRLRQRLDWIDTLC